MVKADIRSTEKFLSVACALCLVVLLSVTSGCSSGENTADGNASANQSSNASSLALYGSKMAMIRINGKYYSCAAKAMPAPSESEILGTITHIRPDDSEVWYCTQDDEVSAGFPEYLNQPYAVVDGNMIIRQGDEWYLLVESDFTPPQ